MKNKKLVRERKTQISDDFRTFSQNFFDFLRMRNKLNVFIYKGTFANKDFENKKLTLLGVV